MIEKLDWDSTFFNLKIGKVMLDKLEDLPESEKNNFDLIYVFSNNPNLDLKLVDQKIIYEIDLLSIQRELQNKEIFFFDAAKDDYDNLLSLTLQSGVYSRFKLDPNFRNNEYEKLYKKWIDKSILGELATDIIIRKIDDKIVGFTTLSRKNKHLADISLVAVDSNYRGQGIAKELIDKTLFIAKERKYEKVQVVTQLINEPANNLYIKSGFNRKSLIYIYHIWNHDTI